MAKPELLAIKNHEVKMTAWVAFVRIFLGAFWLFEVTIGHNWKIGSFTSGGHPGWFGEKAGSYLIEQGNLGIEAGTWSWFGWILENWMYPHAAGWGYFAVVVQLLLGFAFMIGAFSRPMAVLGLGMDFFIYMLGNSRVPPFFTVGHLFVIATGAGMYYGVDGLLMNKYGALKSGGAKLLKSLITFNFLTPRLLRLLASVSAVLAVYYLLKVAVIETGKMKMVSMDLAVLFGFVSFGLYMYKEKADQIALTISLTRIWLGYRFLHEIFVRVDPALNGIPGWGSGEKLKAVFVEISENHWGLFSGIVESVFIPAAGFWAFIFAAVQTAVAIMLLLGIRTRLASKSAFIFLSLLIVLGFTRYEPLMIGYVIAVWALDGGSMFSFDKLKNKETQIGIKLPNMMIIVLIAISLVMVIAANVDGILPDGYKTSMGPVMGAMVAILCALLALAGLMQNGFKFSLKSDSNMKNKSISG